MRLCVDGTLKEFLLLLIITHLIADQNLYGIFDAGLRKSCLRYDSFQLQSNGSFNLPDLTTGFAASSMPGPRLGITQKSSL